MLIGITGTDGAGKGTVVEYLVKQKGYLHFSSRGVITRELLRRGLPTDRIHLREMGNQLRTEHGDDFLVTFALRLVQPEALDYMIIESIRTVAEAKTLKDRGGVLLAVDADQALRYQRISERNLATDAVTYEQFVAQEKLEMDDPDPHGMQKARVMAMADYTIMNNGSLADLEKATDEALQQLSLRQV